MSELHYFDPNTMPTIPRSVTEFAQDAKLSTYVLHLYHPKGGGRDITFIMMSHFLPREGEAVSDPFNDRPYKVRKVLHKAVAFQIEKTTAYTSKAHVICVPKDYEDDDVEWEEPLIDNATH